MKEQKITKSDSGIYILEIQLNRKLKLEAKKFLGKTLHSGFYYYTGSAQKNLTSRLQRHLKKEKVINWHIDHLTAYKHSQIVSVYLFINKPKIFEAELANSMNSDDKFTSPLKGFGNGDTKETYTHLFYSEKQVNQNHFISLYHSTVRLTPSEIEIS